MPDDNKKRTSNLFINKSIYPDAASVFNFRLQHVEEIKEHCLIVLDTNVLLAPYTIAREDLLEYCKKTYSSLVENQRLFIPGQVAREFAKNRASKLAELYQQLSRKKQFPSIQTGRYPLLKSVEEYEGVLRLEELINIKIREYQKTLTDILAKIQSWQWNDPVSLLYQEIFPREVVIDPVFDEEDIRKDLDRRHEHSIPPGYKDSGKGDEGVGDLLIWHTILKLGEANKKSVIFVSGDEKADWFQKSEGQPLYLRYELVDEFRRVSEGESFHIIKFSQFLELFGANEKIVEEVKNEEDYSTEKNLIENNILEGKPVRSQLIHRTLSILEAAKIPVEDIDFHLPEFIDVFAEYQAGFLSEKILIRAFNRAIDLIDVKEFASLLASTRRGYRGIMLINHINHRTICIEYASKSNILITNERQLIKYLKEEKSTSEDNGQFY